MKKAAPASDTPAYAVASLACSVAGLALGAWISWMLSVAAGIAAIVLGVMARRRSTALRSVALAGIVLGALNVVGSLVLVGVAVYQIMQFAQLGVL